MLAGVNVPLFVVVTELTLSSNLFLMFLVIAAVRALVALTTFINHVRMFIAIRAHRNQVLDVALSNQQQAMILRREKKVAHHIMILIATIVICLVPPLLLKAFSHRLLNSIITCFHGLCQLH